MRIASIEISNFRCFEFFKIDSGEYRSLLGIDLSSPTVTNDVQGHGSRRSLGIGESGHFAGNRING